MFRGSVSEGQAQEVTCNLCFIGWLFEHHVHLRVTASVQVFLHLACNRLENLAENIQGLVELKILIVEGNSLHSLPKALCCLTR